MGKLTKAEKDAIKRSWEHHTQEFGATKTERIYKEHEELYCKTIAKHFQQYNPSTKEGKEHRNDLIYQLSLYNEPKCN